MVRFNGSSKRRTEVQQSGDRIGVHLRIGLERASEDLPAEVFCCAVNVAEAVLKRILEHVDIFFKSIGDDFFAPLRIQISVCR